MITLTYSVIATYTLGQVTKISRLLRASAASTATRRAGSATSSPTRTGSTTSPSGSALVVYALIRYIVRTPFGITLQGVRDEPIRMSSLGYNVPLHRTLAFGFAAFLASLGGVLYVWWAGQVAPGDVDLPADDQPAVMAVIGGLVRIEGAWVGAFAFIVMQNYITRHALPRLGFGGTLFGGSFNTIIGMIFLVIVVVSPDGLHRALGTAVRGGRRIEGGDPTPAAAPEPAK